MSVIISLLSSPPSLIIPKSLLEWFLAIILVTGVILLVRRWNRFNKPMNRQRWLLFIGLSLLTPLTSLAIGLRLPASVISPRPDLPIDPLGPAIMVFAAIPWMLAAGFLGPTSAAGLAGFSGIFLSLWETHNPYTPLILALFATLFSAAVNQRYRKSIYTYLRHPIVTGSLLTLLYPVLYLVVTPITEQTPFVLRIEYTLTGLGISVLIIGIEFLIGGLVTELLAIAIPTNWGGESSLLVSPPERTIEARLLYLLVPVSLALLVALVITNWYLAGRSARGLIENNMSSTAKVAAQNVPGYLELGQVLILETAKAIGNLDLQNPQNLRQVLLENLQNKPFFDQFLVFNRNGELITAYPDNSMTGTRMDLDERYAIEDALSGFPFQIETLKPNEKGKQSAIISFISPIRDENQVVIGALLGRSDPTTNQISQALIASLSSMDSLSGELFIINEQGKIIFHSNPELVMTEYEGQSGVQQNFFEAQGTDGTRQLRYFQPVTGYPWSIVLNVPQTQADILSLTIAIPMLIIMIVLTITAFVTIRMGVRTVTSSLRRITVEAERISVGDLNQPVPVVSEDEVGVLAQSFEKMRRSLKKRIDDLDRLFTVSQEVGSKLIIDDAIEPVLDAALITGANSVRVVLSPDAIPELVVDPLIPIVYHSGEAENQYEYLDEQVLDYSRRHERLILPNLKNPRIFDLPEDQEHPASIIAFSLRKDDTYYGSFWVAFPDTQNLSKSETNYLATLASQATVAAANTRLYLSAEFERQRLSAIIASSPDPVLVTDQQNRLILANPAAWKILNIPIGYDDKAPIDEIIQQTELAQLLKASVTEKRTLDVEMPNGDIYLAIATTVVSDDQPVGRVCTLRDVTRLKESDTLKSEFVSTVSHHLRSPLTLIQGYATMVEMVGKLNEQQADYLQKIIENVERMSRLVNNLLDLRRIEAGSGIQVEMVSVRELVQGVAESLSIHAAQKRLQVRVNIPMETVPLIEADKNLLTQAIYNLLDNAIKYTSHDGQIDIQVYIKNDRIYFQISDTGVGISPYDQAQLFERIFHKTTRDSLSETPGSGLGLAIVKLIADRHGGDVWVESQLGKGSTFYLAIPLRQTVLDNQK